VEEEGVVGFFNFEGGQEAGERREGDEFGVCGNCFTEVFMLVSKEEGERETEEEDGDVIVFISTLLGPFPNIGETFARLL